MVGLRRPLKNSPDQCGVRCVLQPLFCLLSQVLQDEGEYGGAQGWIISELL